MYNIIQDTFHRIWTSGRKTKQSGEWTIGNAPCCTHNGDRQDSKSRGHVRFDPDGSINYGCFNCKFKATYIPGHQLSYNFRNLMRWSGATDSEVQLSVFEALREKEKIELLGGIKPHVEVEEVKVVFEPKPLPKGAQSILGIVAFTQLLPEEKQSYPKELHAVVKYAADRCIDFQKYDIYWTTERTFKMDQRIIIPFTWKKEIIGYTSRAIDDKIYPKYIMEVDSGYVFNMDKQTDAKQVVIVVEGPIDAMSIDGVAIMHNEISDQQIKLLESLNKEIIVVPDFEKSGTELVKTAMERGWSVSFPLWSEKCKDANAAVVKYGKLFVLRDILDRVESNKLKIELMWRNYKGKK